MVESTGVFQRRRFHRAKAHLVLSAMRHRAAELGDRLTYVQAETYAEVVREVEGDVEVVHPTSYAALGLVERLGCDRPAASRLRHRAGGLRALGRGPSRQAAAAWRTSTGAHAWRTACCSTAANRPAASGTSTTTTASHRPSGADTLGVTEPWWPSEDDIDAQVREDLDRWERDGEVSFVGARRAADLPGHPAPRRWRRSSTSSSTGCRSSGRTRTRSSRATRGWRTACSRAPMNLGLLDPLEVVERAEEAYRSGAAPIAERRGLRPPGHRVARLRLARLLAHRATDYRPRERPGRPGADPAVVRRARRRGDRRPLPVPHARRGRASTAGCTTSRG